MGLEASMGFPCYKIKSRGNNFLIYSAPETGEIHKPYSCWEEGYRIINKSRS